MHFEHLATVGSTQDEARARYRDGPVVVSAAEQTAGRGRQGREWWQAPRAIAVSVAFDPGWPETARAVVPLVAGLAARDVLGDAVGLKWPNDLLVAGCKVGGILSEAAGGLVVVGLGANVWWPQAPSGAGALLGAEPGPGWEEMRARAWADRLLERAAAGAERWGRTEYRSACVTVGSRVAWPDGAGIAVDIAADGALVVESDAGDRREIRSGEVGLVTE